MHRNGVGKYSFTILCKGFHVLTKEQTLLVIVYYFFLQSQNVKVDVTTLVTLPICPLTIAINGLLVTK